MSGLCSKFQRLFKSLPNLGKGASSRKYAIENRSHTLWFSLFLVVARRSSMEASAVKRLICVTGFGAGDSRGCGGLFYNAALCLILRRIYADKDAQEWIIRRSGLGWTIVRPTILTTGPRTGSYRELVDERDWRSGFISRADVADFLLKQVNDASLAYKTLTLTG